MRTFSPPASFLSVADLVVLNMLTMNRGTRPIAISSTVDQSAIDELGLQNYLVDYGLVSRLSARAYSFIKYDWGALDSVVNYLAVDTSTFQWAGFSEDVAVQDGGSASLLSALAAIYAQTANRCSAAGKKQKAAQVLKRMAEILPLEKVPVFADEKYRGMLIDLFQRAGLSSPFRPSDAVK